MLKETSSKKKHFQNDSRIIFSSIFNFVVISRLKCNLKINFSYWKFRHFKKDSAYLSSFDFFNFSNHDCQRVFWTWWILSSDVWIKLILVSKLFLSLVNTRNNKKIHQIQGFQHLSVWFFFAFFFAIIQITVINVMILKFSFEKNIQNFKHHLQKERIWNKTTFFKVQILYRGCGLSFTPLCNERTSSEISSLYKEDFVWFFNCYLRDITRFIIVSSIFQVIWKKCLLEEFRLWKAQMQRITNKILASNENA